MLRMPEFEVHLPTTAADAVRLKSELPDSLYVAGGTDLLPNLKHQLHHPKHLVSLAHVRGLDAIELADDHTLTLGARATLHAVASASVVADAAPVIAVAAGEVAGPQHRRMGTLGGNVMLDTRCLFYNQTAHWRQSLNHCLKAEGTWCHVIGSATACVAAQSSDTVPGLVALDAHIEALLPSGPTVSTPLRSLFTKDGRLEQMHTLPAHALVTRIVVPPRAPGHRSTYRKVRTRGAVDYPQLGVAVVVALDAQHRLTQLEVVLGALMPQPKRVSGLDAWLGEPLSDDVVEAVADKAFRQAKPQSQLHGDPSWRRHLARVETQRALTSLRPPRPGL